MCLGSDASWGAAANLGGCLVTIGWGLEWFCQTGDGTPWCEHHPFSAHSLTPSVSSLLCSTRNQSYKYNTLWEQEELFTQKNSSQLQQVNYDLISWCCGRGKDTRVTTGIIESLLIGNNNRHGGLALTDHRPGSDCIGDSHDTHGVYYTSELTASYNNENGKQPESSSLRSKTWWDNPRTVTREVPAASPSGYKPERFDVTATRYAAMITVLWRQVYTNEVST